MALFTSFDPTTIQSLRAHDERMTQGTHTETFRQMVLDRVDVIKQGHRQTERKSYHPESFERQVSHNVRIPAHIELAQRYDILLADRRMAANRFA
jgi:hypothetical protein